MVPMRLCVWAEEGAVRREMVKRNGNVDHGSFFWKPMYDCALCLGALDSAIEQLDRPLWRFQDRNCRAQTASLRAVDFKFGI